MGFSQSNNLTTMATLKPISVPTKRLLNDILSTDHILQVNNILSWAGMVDGVTLLKSADFGSFGFGVFRNTTNTQLELFTWDPATIANTQITILKRGLFYDGSDVEYGAPSYNWPANSTLVELGANVPELFAHLADLYSDETFNGKVTFVEPPTVPTPTATTDAANKAYVDGIAQSGGADASHHMVLQQMIQ
jgi:hypothetical protein